MSSMNGSTSASAPRCVVGGAHARRAPARAGLMRDARPLAGGRSARSPAARTRSGRARRGCRRRRAARSAPLRPAKRSCGGGDRRDLRAHRIAGDDRPSRRPGAPSRRRSRTRSGARPAQHPVASSSVRVGVDDEQRPAEQPRHPAAGKADVAAHAEHGVGAPRERRCARWRRTRARRRSRRHQRCRGPCRACR